MPVKPEPWPAGRDKRVSINSFGIGGSNAHVCLHWFLCPACVFRTDDPNHLRLSSSRPPRPSLLTASRPRESRLPLDFSSCLPIRQTHYSNGLQKRKPIWNGPLPPWTTWPTRLRATVRSCPIELLSSPIPMEASSRRPLPVEFSARAPEPSWFSVVREPNGLRWARNLSRQTASSEESLPT